LWRQSLRNDETDKDVVQLEKRLGHLPPWIEALK